MNQKYIFCQKCGHKNSINSEYCTNCGRPLRRKTQTQNNTAQQHDTNISNNKPKVVTKIIKEPIQQKTHKKSHKGIIATIIAIILLCCAGTGGYIYYENSPASVNMYHEASHTKWSSINIHSEAPKVLPNSSIYNNTLSGATKENITFRPIGKHKIIFDYGSADGSILLMKLRLVSNTRNTRTFKPYYENSHITIPKDDQSTNKVQLKGHYIYTTTKSDLNGLSKDKQEIHSRYSTTLNGKYAGDKYYINAPAAQSFDLKKLILQK